MTVLPPLQPEAAALVARAFSEAGVAAGAVIVVQGGLTRLHLHGPRQPGGAQPVGPHTPFSVGSLAKAAAALAVAAQVERGRLAWDQPAREAAPAFGWPTPRHAAECTLAHWLGNASGLAPTWPLDEQLGREVPIDDVLARAAHLSVVAPPGRTFRYLNLGFVAAARAVERAAGRAYAEVLHDTVLAPLGLHHSAAWPRVQALAEAPVAALGGEPPRVLDGTGYANHPGAGWLYLSPADAATWMRFWIDAARGEAPLAGGFAPATLQRLTTPIVDVPAAEAGLWMAPPGEGAAYGFGWAHTRFHGQPVMQHSGATVGATAHLMLLPAARLGLACFCSGRRLYRAALLDALAEACLGHAPSRDWLALGRAALEAFDAEAASATPAHEGEGEGEGDDRAHPPPAAAFTGRWRGAACGPAAITALDEQRLALRFDDAPAWACTLTRRAGSRFDVALDTPNEGLRFMAARPAGRFVFEARDAAFAARFEHPFIETLHRADRAVDSPFDAAHAAP